MKVKGIGLKHTLAAIEKLHGKPALARVHEAMPPRLSEVLANVKMLDWYPIELSAAMHAAIREALGNGTWDESHRISRAAALAEIAGPYRMLLRAVQYDTIWDRMERMWSQFYDTGEARWTERGRGHATAEVMGVAGFTEGIWRSVCGRVEGVLEATGARGPAVTLKNTSSTKGTIEALWLE